MVSDRGSFGCTSETTQGTVTKGLQDVQEPNEQKIESTPMPDADQLYSGTIQISQSIRPSSNSSNLEGTILDIKKELTKDEIIYVEFEEGDASNPVNFSKTAKWVITIIACYGTVMAATVAGSYTMGFDSMMRDLNCNNFEAITGLSTYALGFAVVPLVSASLSEEFGRKPLYNFSGLIFLLMFVLIALANHVQTVIIGRLFQGMAGSTCATVVGGTIADIWSPQDRGIPMAVFSFAVVGGTGLGPVIGGWIEMNPHLQWRWIQWIQMILQSVFLLLTLVLRETRPEILLTRRAKQLRQETGDNRYRARVEVERPKFVVLLKTSCARSLYLAFTEPIVAAISLWTGLAWGVMFIFISTIPLVYQTVHRFNIGLIGTTYVSMIIGAILGFLTNFIQQYFYLKNYSKRGPEARLYAACVAALMLPAAIFIYAWSTLPQVHWIALNIGVVLLMWAAYIIYHSLFSYLADCYGTWVSSASAGQNFTRNLITTVFTLFGLQMFEKLSYKWACTLLGCLAVLLAPTPFMLFFWGPAIRKRSKVASRLTEV